MKPGTALVQIIRVRDTRHHHSEWPHELVCLDFNEHNALIAVTVAGGVDAVEAHVETGDPPYDPTMPVGRFERMLAHAREDADEARADKDALENQVFELFNPPDDDSTNAADVIKEAHTFILSFPCKCTNTDPTGASTVPYDDGDQCARCKVLGRYFDTPIGR